MAKKLTALLLVLVMITSITGLSALGLEKGDKGEQVKKLQRRLIVLGYLDTTKVTGKYDDAEEDAVKQFQLSSGIAPTGVADDETLEAIYNKNAKKALKTKHTQTSDKNDGNAESKMLKFSTERLLTFLKKYTIPFEIDFPTTLTEKEMDDKSIIVLLTKYSTLPIVLILVFIALKILLNILFWLTHRKPLTDDQISKLADVRKNLYINQHFKFSTDGYKINPKYRESLDKDGRWDRVEIQYPIIGAAVAELLRYKRHEWFIIILANENEAKYIWANKGDDNSSCYSKVNLLQISQFAKSNDCNTVLDFHNHPHTKERYWNLLSPSQTDINSLKTWTDYFTKAGLNYISGIVSQGQYIIYGYEFSEMYHPPGCSIEEIKEENNKSKKHDYQLQKELKKIKNEKISNKLFR